MQKKGQISVFIIIGIIVIAVFGFMYFITTEVSKIQLETQANKIVDSILATTPIDYYVTLCLEEATKQALNISGKQGGGPILLGETTLTLGGTEVKYFIDYPQNNPEPDAWPCNDEMQQHLIEPAYCAYLNDISVFLDLNETELGGKNFPALCRYANEPCTRGMSKDFNVTVQGTRIEESMSFRGLNSIQEYVEEMIANKTKNCSAGILNVSESNLTAFRTFNITVGEINVTTTFGFNGIEVTADYPLNIKIQDLEPVIRILKFNYFSPVRYKYVYLFATWLAYQEFAELDFDINDSSDWSRNEEYALPGFSVVTAKNNDNDMIITIRDLDENHFLRAGPFVFNFAIKDRPPVLDYIPGYDSPAEYQAVINRDYDLYNVEGEMIQIFPQAYDPDGDKLNYSYSGWKETEDAYFDEAQGCTRDNPQDCVMVQYNEEPHIWTNSELFTLTNQSANYTTNHSDIGYHNVTVCAFQDNNPETKDCQIVRILVDDVFNVLINFTRCYDDIDNRSIISVEDPLCLDADVIDYFNPGSTNYQWQAIEDGVSETIYIGPNDSVVLPRDYDGHRSNPDRYLPGNVGYFSTIGKKTFELLVERGSTTLGSPPTTGSASKEAEAFKCIPHRQNIPEAREIAHPVPEIPSQYPSFPFHNIDYQGQESPYNSYPDPFFGNHTCCAGNPDGEPETWKYAESSRECYRYAEYGFYNASFINFTEQANQYETVSIIPPVTTSYSSTNKPKPNLYNLTNDIILRIFNSTCSGDSGIICDDNAEMAYTNITACEDLSDWNKAGEQLARCQGANVTAQFYSGTTSCITFTGTTFEQYLYENNKGGFDSEICGPPRCTEDKIKYAKNRYDWESAFWLCNATCDDGNCDKTTDCINCRLEEGYVPTKDPDYTGTEDDYKIQQTTVVQAGYCYPDNPSAGRDSCLSRPRIELTDKCSTDDQDVLIEYSFHHDYEKYPEANYTMEKSCSAVFETEAEITLEEGIRVCIPGNTSSCDTGACVIEEATVNDELSEDCLGPDEKKFRNVTKVDTNGNEILDGCALQNTDPDNSQHGCELCGLIWTGTGCSGDDPGE